MQQVNQKEKHLAINKAISGDSYKTIVSKKAGVLKTDSVIKFIVTASLQKHLNAYSKGSFTAYFTSY